MLPTVLNTEGPVVIFGGGQVGMRKVQYVSNFTRDIILVTESSEELPEHVTLIQTKLELDSFHEYIPENTSLVISALSDNDLNAAIAKWCSEHKMLVNVVDDTEKCTVIFPALSLSNDLSIAVSTSGRCPFLARKVREELDVHVVDWGNWLEVLAPIREKLVGTEEKDRILNSIYNDPDIINFIKEGKLKEAYKKAEEVCNVHNKS